MSRIFEEINAFIYILYYIADVSGVFLRCLFGACVYVKKLIKIS